MTEVVPAAGAQPFAERSPAHRRYCFEREIQRWSEERKAPVIGYPTHHQNDTTLVNCMLIAGAHAGHNVDRLSHAPLEAHWRFDADLADVATLERIATQAGYVASDLMGAAREPQALAMQATAARPSSAASSAHRPTSPTATSSTARTDWRC